MTLVVANKEWARIMPSDVVDLLDIVDDQDRVIGVAEKEEIHRLRLRHRFVQVLVVNDKGEILIQERSRRKKRGAFLLDASVGGHVDHGESYDQAVRREGVEELGLPEDAAYQLLGTITDDTSLVENMIGRLYLLRSNGPFSNWEEEAEQLIWFAPATLVDMMEQAPERFTAGVMNSVRLYLSMRTPT